jgi:hypothetical protein
LDVNNDKTCRLGTIVPVVLVALLLAPSLISAKTLDWGSVKEVTDPGDTHLNNLNRPVGYLDQGITTANYNGRMYVAWETSERTKGGSMIYVRSLKDTIWGDIEAVGGVEDGIVDTEATLAAYDGDLYLAWQHAGSDDTDIECMVLSEGKWSSCGHISPVGNFGIDSSPALAVMNGYLWCAWVTRSVTTGKDPNGDIVLRSFNGMEWTDKISVVNPTPANGYDDQPRLINYNNRLVITWVTRDPKITNGTDMEIVMRDFDGENWGQYHEVTGIDGINDDDTYPSMASYMGKLFIAWQAAGSGPTNMDIHVATWDGSSITARTSLTPSGNKGADEHPFAEYFDGKLYVAWNSNDPNYTSGSADDIAIAYYDGDKWSSPEEVTPYDQEGEYAAVDRFPVLESYHGGLYAIWEQDDQRSSVKVMDPGDLKYRRYPPDQAKINYFMVGLVVIVIILVIAFIALWALGPKRSNREKRYIERRKRKSLHIDARSRAGGRTYSGHKRRHHQKK